MNKLHILTLNWDGQDKLAKLYPTVMKALHNIDYTWHIKDNGSKDNSVEYINSFNNSNVNIIAYKNNLQNFSQGCNYLFNEASPADDDYVLLLNNDVIINASKSIKNMINIMEENQEVGVVGARLLYTNTDKLQHAGVYFDKNNRTPAHFRANEKSDLDAEKNREFQAVTGAVLLTKAKYYKEANKNKSGSLGLDESLNWAFDDIDYCLSVKYKMNKKIVYCGNTNIYHEESASLKKNPTNKLFMPANVRRFVSKWGGIYALDEDEYHKNTHHNLYRI
jgi:GT2 family glycosyltransferase